jgi:hypothetical protein
VCVRFGAQFTHHLLWINGKDRTLCARIDAAIDVVVVVAEVVAVAVVVSVAVTVLVVRRSLVVAVVVVLAVAVVVVVTIICHLGASLYVLLAKLRQNLAQRRIDISM